jgi:phage tail sheath protein FI
MTDYGAPGVYVQEVPSGPRPITAVGTSTAAFLGIAPQSGAHLGEAVPIDNWTQFLTEYAADAAEGTDLSSAVYGFFANGGGRCYVVNLGDKGSLEGTAREPGGLQLIEAVDEVAIVAAPGYHDVASYEALLGHCEAPNQQDRVAILDPPSGLGRGDVDRLTQVAQEAPPAPHPSPAPNTRSVGSEGRGRRGRSGSNEDTAAAEQSGLRPRQSDGGYGAFYFPWFRIRCPVSGNEISAPPSGHMAGIWARTDSSRGVHKAPANEELVGALSLEYQVSRTEQETLNPAGVNCIRFFPAEGIRVWGSRTLADPAGEWRYINVRRLTNMLKESIADGTRWIVFEPNSDQLWSEIRRDVSAFLTRVWQDGALVGVTANDAFFVKCDAETNPPEIRDAGQVVTIIGIAAVKPAEFVVFKLMQSTLTGSVATVGG